MLKRCVIHIGTEKTGTSSIQHLLSANRERFASEGVVYPRFTGEHGGSQEGFVVACKPESTAIAKKLGLTNPEKLRAYRDELLASVADQISSTAGAHTLLISSEHFHSRLTNQADIQSLKLLLCQFATQFQIIVYFRRQDKLALSRYSTVLKTGTTPKSVFQDLSKKSNFYYYDYLSVYSNWAAVFGAENVSVGLYEKNEWKRHDLLTDFCNRANLTIDNKDRPPRINESLSSEGIALMKALNERWVKKYSDTRGALRQLVALSIATHHPGEATLSSRRDALNFLQHFKEGNELLRHEAFADRVDPLFDDDVSCYPEAAPNLPQPDFKTLAKFILALPARDKKRTKELLRLAGRTWLSRIRQSLPHVLLKKHASTPTHIDRDLYFHVGLPKAGSTSLQRSFFSQHPQLVQLEEFKRRGIKWMFGESKSKLRLLHLQPQAYLSNHVSQILSRVAGDHPEGTLLGSMEALILLPPKKFEFLITTMEETFRSLNLIFILRNPLQRLPSAYLHAIRTKARTGNHATIPDKALTPSFEEWLLRGPFPVKSLSNLSLHDKVPLSATPEHLDTRFNYTVNVRKAVEVLGAKQVHVLLFEDLVKNNQLFMDHFCEILGIDPRQNPISNLPHENTGMSVAEWEFICALEQADMEERRAWWRKTKNERRTELQKAKEVGKVEKFAPSITPESHQWICRKTAPFHRWLDTTYNLDLKAKGYPVDVD